MFVHAFAEKRNVRRQRHVAGHFLPRELESIAGKPHILAAARNRVASFRRVVFHGTRMKNRSNVPVAFKQTDWRGSKPARLLRLSAVLCSEDQYRYVTKRRQTDNFPSV